jgi:hypothetical protein
VRPADSTRPDRNTDCSTAGGAMWNGIWQLAEAHAGSVPDGLEIAVVQASRESWRSLLKMLARSFADGRAAFSALLFRHVLRLLSEKGGSLEETRVARFFAKTVRVLLDEHLRVSVRPAFDLRRWLAPLRETLLSAPSGSPAAAAAAPWRQEAADTVADLAHLVGLLPDAFWRNSAFPGSPSPLSCVLSRALATAHGRPPPNQETWLEAVPDAADARVVKILADRCQIFVSGDALSSYLGSMVRIQNRLVAHTLERPDMIGSADTRRDSAHDENGAPVPSSCRVGSWCGPGTDDEFALVAQVFRSWARPGGFPGATFAPTDRSPGMGASGIRTVARLTGVAERERWVDLVSAHTTGPVFEDDLFHANGGYPLCETRWMHAQIWVSRERALTMLARPDAREPYQRIKARREASLRAIEQRVDAHTCFPTPLLALVGAYCLATLEQVLHVHVDDGGLRGQLLAAL